MKPITQQTVLQRKKRHNKSLAYSEKREADKRRIMAAIMAWRVVRL